MNMTRIHRPIALSTERSLIGPYIETPDVAVGVGAVTPDAGIDTCFCVKGTMTGVQVGDVLE